MTAFLLGSGSIVENKQREQEEGLRKAHLIGGLLGYQQGSLQQKIIFLGPRK